MELNFLYILKVVSFSLYEINVVEIINNVVILTRALANMKNEAYALCICIGNNCCDQVMIIAS